MKKYFNPLKPDSARIVYELLPREYQDPDAPPNPISFQVEIRDKDQNLVYGPRDLTNQEQKFQVLWWDGKDNSGTLVDFEQGPFEAKLTVYYRESAKERFLWGCERKTPLYPTEFDLIAYDYLGNEVPEDSEVNPGAYVHFNLDNDDASDNSIGEPKYPGSDYLQVGPIAGEDDLKLVKIKIKPFMETGKVVLQRDNTNIRVWSNKEKGNINKVLYDNNEKEWNLADPIQRAEFDAIKNNLWVEGMAYNGESHLFIWYYDAAGNRWTGDLVKYHFIAADCGRQPRTEGEHFPGAGESQRGAFENSFLNLKRCEWSITRDMNIYYNCIAWSVGIIDRWVWQGNIVDSVYEDNWGRIHINIDWFGPPTRTGYKDHKLDSNDFDAFYDEYNYEITTDPDEAEIILYKANSAIDPCLNPEGITHAARKHNCNCGADRWLMFESKCGTWEAIEHVDNQLNGDEPSNPVRANYGFPFRYYKHK